MIQNQEESLRAYLHEAIKNKAPTTVLQLKISLLDPVLRTENTLGTIVDNFRDALYPYGRAFYMANDDIFIAYSLKTKENEIKALLIKTWIWFSADPLASTPEKLERRFFLPQDKTSLMEELRRITATAQEEKDALPVTAGVKKKFILPPSNDKNHKLLTPEMLSRMEKALTGTDFANMIRRQSVCAVLDDIDPQPMFEEVFVSIADLGDAILPDVSLTATPWLFQDLTETLDKRILLSISRHDDKTLTHDFSLNLNVSSILSDNFKKFDDNLLSGVKSSIVLELQPVDIFSDLSSYLLARDYAQNQGYKICIDGVTEKSLRFIDRERLGADFLKLIWTPELPEIFGNDPLLQDRLQTIGANRAVLCRVDDEQALKFGKFYNISLFQGRYIQNLLANNIRRRRVGTTLLRR